MLYYIPTDFNIPYYNMALEEYLLTDEKFTENEYLFFYINDPSVIIGSHQNAYAEINKAYITKNNVYVARRLSGGGAVYHDRGNLNFSFILNKDNNKLIDFKRYTLPVVNALKQLNLNAQLSGRNDILLDGRKISGNAEYVNKNKILHHGTLMFDVNTEEMLNCLNVDNLKIEAKAIKSVKSRVANIKQYLEPDFDIILLREKLRKAFTNDLAENEYNLTAADIAAVKEKVENKFSLESFNYGEKQSFMYEKKARFTAGIVCVGLDIKKGIIEKFNLTGDFFANKDIKIVCENLTNVDFSHEAVEKILKNIDFDSFIVNFSAQELLALMFFEA